MELERVNRKHTKANDGFITIMFADLDKLNSMDNQDLACEIKIKAIKECKTKKNKFGANVLVFDFEYKGIK